MFHIGDGLQMQKLEVEFQAGSVSLLQRIRRRRAGLGFRIAPDVGRESEQVVAAKGNLHGIDAQTFEEVGLESIGHHDRLQTQVLGILFIERTILIVVVGAM